MLRKVREQAWLLEQLFGFVVQPMRAGDGTFTRDDVLSAVTKAGWCSDVADPRERQLQLMEQAQFGLTWLTRAKLIKATTKLDFTPNLRLTVERVIGSSTKLGRLLGRCNRAFWWWYLFGWSLWDRVQRWRWLISVGPVIAWFIGWRAHVISIEHTALAWTVFAWTIFAACVASVWALLGE